MPAPANLRTARRSRDAASNALQTGTCPLRALLCARRSRPAGGRQLCHLCAGGCAPGDLQRRGGRKASPEAVHVVVSDRRPRPLQGLFSAVGGAAGGRATREARLRGHRGSRGGLQHPGLVRRSAAVESFRDRPRGTRRHGPPRTGAQHLLRSGPGCLQREPSKLRRAPGGAAVLSAARGRRGGERAARGAALGRHRDVCAFSRKLCRAASRGLRAGDHPGRARAAVPRGSGGVRATALSYRPLPGVWQRIAEQRVDSARAYILPGLRPLRGSLPEGRGRPAAGVRGDSRSGSRRLESLRGAAAHGFRSLTACAGERTAKCRRGRSSELRWPCRCGSAAGPRLPSHRPGARRGALSCLGECRFEVP